MAGNSYRSMTQIILETLRERIYEGAYGPGARLNITDLARQLEASPVPVREALRNLESEGLVEFRLNRGVVVKELSADEVRELFLIRLPLESLAASEAVLRGSDDDYDALERLLKGIDKAKNITQWHALHEEFHREFYGLSQSPRLSGYVNVLRGQMRPYSKLSLSDPRHVKQAQEEHYAMVAAARKKDIAALRKILRSHLTRPAHKALLALGVTDFEEFDSQVIT